MNTASCEKEAPSLSRDEAIAILDTPDEELEALIVPCQQFTLQI